MIFFAIYVYIHSLYQWKISLIPNELCDNNMNFQELAALNNIYHRGIWIFNISQNSSYDLDNDVEWNYSQANLMYDDA